MSTKANFGIAKKGERLSTIAPIATTISPTPAAERGEDWIFAGGLSITSINSLGKVSANRNVTGSKALTGTLMKFNSPLQAKGK